MKWFKSPYYIALFVLFLLTACQSDEALEQGGGEPGSPQLVEVRLHISPAGSSSADARTRADWRDTWATNDEMMNLWTVIIVDAATDAVKEIQSCKPTGTYTAGTDDDREVDIVTELPTGEYRFYSFANIGGSSLESLLGLPTGSVPVPSANDVIEKKAIGDDLPGNTGPISDLGHIYPRGSNNNPQGGTAIEDRTITINGNNFDPTAADNGFGAKGIPMSNVQTKTITSSTTFDLIVIRMMAKIELRLYNDRGSDLTIQSVTLTDVNRNVSDNLKVLPVLANHDDMPYHHGDISPNLGSGAATSDLTVTVNKGVSSAKTLASGNYETVSFYVNESGTPTNAYGHFYLKLQIMGETEARYALIDYKGATTDDDNKWNYIARNDYRIIPVVLDDYKLDIIPYDFPAIGVYPASVKDEDGLFSINFHDYGHFHLVPTVTKMSDNTVVPFTTTAPSGTYATTSWGLAEDAFASSWNTWTTSAKTTTGDGGFYRTGSEDYITTLTDGDEVGGAPVWYANSATPQWDPSGGTTYKPFIFGYIADPGAALSEDKKVYHEFTVNIYRQGTSVPRVMTYRLYMILDTEQMMYARRRGVGTARHMPHSR